MEKEIDIYKGYYSDNQFSCIADYLKFFQEQINEIINENFVVKKYEMRMSNLYINHFFTILFENKHFFTILFENKIEEEKVKKFISSIQMENDKIKYQIKGKYLFVQIFA